MPDRRLEIGFAGGTILRVTVAQDAADALVAALDSAQWHALDADEGTYWLNSDEILYVRLVAESGPRVGFGTA